ncbi:Uncharacterised protein [Klebsiella pneumoniae]|nr:Uncharacterised protein [Klebsiella pneumoniae]
MAGASSSAPNWAPMRGWRASSCICAAAASIRSASMGATRPPSSVRSGRWSSAWSGACRRRTAASSATRCRFPTASPRRSRASASMAPAATPRTTCRCRAIRITTNRPGNCSTSMQTNSGSSLRLSNWPAGCSPSSAASVPSNGTTRWPCAIPSNRSSRRCAIATTPARRWPRWTASIPNWWRPTPTCAPGSAIPTNWPATASAACSRRSSIGSASRRANWNR